MGPGDAPLFDRSVALQRSSFGDVVREYAVDVAGAIATLQGNGMLEPGMRIGYVPLNGPDPACDGSGCNDEEGEPIE
jgi:hypothetical protein